VRAAVYLLVPALAMMGCASQNIDRAEADAPNPQFEELKHAHAALAAAQAKLEARLTRLETDSTLQAARLDALGVANTALAQQADRLRTEADATASGLSTLADKVEQQGGTLALARESAEDAINIARDSRLVAGKIVESLTLGPDMVLYGYEQPELTAKGREAMDTLIADVKPLMPHAFIEIVGFSDDLSLGSRNRLIALERAESTRRYLHETGGIPLHRMSSISYGDLKPLASDASLEGRQQNQRVVIQVLK
jgi:outer membrane protein OmpA-like peptidoglycan-associated protein